MIVFAIALAAAVAAVPSAARQGAQALAQPGRDSALLHRGADQAVQAKEQEQERALRSLLALGGSEAEQAEVTARLANLLRARGLALTIRAAAEADQDRVAAERDKAAAQAARSEAVALYRELLRKFPRAPKLDEALFFLADALQDSGKDEEAVAAAREMTRRFPRSAWAPAARVFVGSSGSTSSTRRSSQRRSRSTARRPRSRPTRCTRTRSTRRPGAASTRTRSPRR